MPRDSEEAEWDAVVESWFESEEAAAQPEPIKGELLADRPKFVGTRHRSSWHVVFEEYPGRQFVDGITVDGYFKAAWFRDSEGNLLNVRSKAPRAA